MTVYEIISFKQKGITSGNSHYERHRFNKKEEAKTALTHPLYCPYPFYTFTKLTIVFSIAEGKVINSELISCR